MAPHAGQDSVVVGVGCVCCYATLDFRLVAYLTGEPTVRISSTGGLFESDRPEQEEINSFFQEAVTPRVWGSKCFLN